MHITSPALDFHDVSIGLLTFSGPSTKNFMEVIHIYTLLSTNMMRKQLYICVALVQDSINAGN